MKCHSGGLGGHGDTSHGVVIIGIAPGSNEVRLGRPFVGQSGKLLDAMLEGCGWSRDKVYTTNLLCWWNDSPSPEEVARCAPRLASELEAAKARLIIPVGAIPTEHILGAKVGKARGGVFWSPKYDAYVMPTYHPAAVLHGQWGMGSDIVRDLQKIPAILQWPKGGHLYTNNYHVCATPAEAEAVLAGLPRDSLVSLDIETNSAETDKIDVFVDNLLCIGITSKDGTWVIPGDVAHEVTWPTDVQWTFHNGMFDVQGLMRYLGVRLPIVEDTMLMSYTLDERPGNHSLKQLAREYCAAGWYEEAVASNRGTMGKLPAETVYEYNAWDARYTYELSQMLRPRQVADDMRGVYDRLLVPAANMFVDLQYRGIRIDMDKLREISITWFERYLTMESEVVEFAKQCGFPGDINLRSPKQLSRFLYEILGLDPKYNYKSGKLTTDKEALDSLDHPFVTRLREYRTLNTMISSYVLGVQDDIKRDGHIHPRVMLHNTVTGRLAYQDPPIHGIPKAYTVGAEYARIREIIVPDSPDHVIVEADYEQIEVWIGQYATGDQQLLADLLTGDVHRQTAAGAFGVTPEAVNDKQRQNAKKIRFGLMYGEGASGLARPEPIGIGGTAAAAQLYIDRFWRRYPTFAAAMRAWEREAIDLGELVTPFGRKRRFPIVLDHRQLRQAINFRIQSIASDYALDSAIQLHPLLAQYGSRILYLVHDAIVFCVHRKHLPEALALIRQVMESPKVPGYGGVRVEIKVGDNLGTVAKYKVAA